MKKSTYLFLGLLVCGVAGGGYYWHQEQKFNDPNGVKITLNPIQPTQYQAEGGEIIAPLVIDFSANIVAPSQVKAPIAQGIKLLPSVKGQWTWENEHALAFMPAQDWAAGQEYQVTLDRQLLNASLSYAPEVTQPQTVKTAPFSVVRAEGEFSQDAISGQHYAVGHIVFSHPVDPKVLEHAIEFKLVQQPKGKEATLIKTLPFNVTYSDNQLEAWIRSEPLALATQEDEFVQISLLKSLQSKLGGNTLDKDVGIPLIAIPNEFSLKNTQSTFSFVNDEEDVLDQVLTLHFNNEVNEEDIADSLVTVLLPALPKGETWSYEKLNESALLQGEVIKPELLGEGQSYTTKTAFRLSVPEERCVYFILNNEFTAKGGYRFKDPLGSLACLPHYPHHVEFVGQDDLLPQYWNSKINLKIRNAQTVTLDVAPLSKTQVLSMINWSAPSLQPSDLAVFKPEKATLFKTETLHTEGENPRYFDFLSVDLVEKGLPSKGIFWLKAEVPVPAEKTEVESAVKNDIDQVTDKLTDYRLLVLTDFDVTTEMEDSGKYIVQVKSLATGEPIEGATIRLVTATAEEREAQATNEKGETTIELPKENAGKTCVLWVTKGEDASFVIIHAP